MKRELISFSGRKVPVIRETDVLVCGGGPAGVGAAIGSARCGVRTLIVEQYGSLGGMGTVGLVCAFMPTKGDNQGVFRDVVEELKKWRQLKIRDLGNTLTLKHSNLFF